MSENTERPSPGEPAEPVAPLPEPQAAAPAGAHPQEAPGRRNVLPALCALGFIVLAGGLIYVWQNPNLPPDVANAQSELQAANAKLAALDSRLKQVEARPAPPPAASPADVQKLASRIEILENRQNADPAQVAQRLDVMAGRIEGLNGRLQTGQDQTKQQFDALSDRVASLEKAANNASNVQSRLDKLARLQDAQLALNAGKPVGDVPDAPPALAKYAHQAPPTQAQLRLSFPQAAQAALAAEQPDLAKAPFAERVWEKAQGLVTVKRGDDVVVGNQSAVALTTAKNALDAGDLAGAVDAVSKLAPAPKQAMADWLGQAQSLLAARQALASMAGQV